ncbi:MAG: pro-sigmaK processing inhibitor BofA family protein [Prevotella sp.]|nr:pro-sigmaK processing inhibitor BofA family protein [Prevotella sp.]
MQTVGFGLSGFDAANSPPPAKLVFYGALALAGIIMLIHFMRSGKPFAAAFKSMASGGLGLVLLHFFGDGLGLALPLNLFTAFVSLTLGLPGTAAMAVIKLLTG